MTTVQPIEVGVTGGIGSGKSLVCRIFGCLGIPIYEADQRAKWLTNHDPEIVQEVIELLGKDSYTSGFHYNRTYVASRVFKDPLLLQKLNQIIHPRVQEDTSSWLKQHTNYKYVIKEAALMDKAGKNNTLDYVVVVTAPFDLRIQRIKERDNWRNDEEIREIIKRQISDEDRLGIADFIISNDINSSLIPQVLTLHNFFIGQET